MSAKTEVRQELFETGVKTYTLPALDQKPLDDAFDEIELLGFALRSPFELLKEEMKVNTLASDLRNLSERDSRSSVIWLRSSTQLQ
ncbi:MAG: hypothetical protein IPN61_10935 [Bacteroidetes bacterium]|nr:hypothetical protein [Bacteroidota bacterium]